MTVTSDSNQQQDALSCYEICKIFVLLPLLLVSKLCFLRVHSIPHYGVLYHASSAKMTFETALLPGLGPHDGQNAFMAFPKALKAGLSACTRLQIPAQCPVGP